MNRIVLFALGLLMVTTYACTKKGCTDSTAGNYSAEAKEDDGSCCYNREVNKFTQTAIYDEFATTNNIAEFTFTQVVTESCSAADATKIKLTIKSLITDTCSFDFNVEMQEDAFTIIWKYENGIVSNLAPGETREYGVVSTNATDIEGMSFVFTGITSVTYP